MKRRGFLKMLGIAVPVVAQLPAKADDYIITSRPYLPEELDGKTRDTVTFAPDMRTTMTCLSYAEYASYREAEWGK